VRLLILGGTEFLSFTTAKLAVAAGHEVVCLARGTHRPSPTGTRFVKADRSIGPSAYTALTGTFDAVIDVSWDPMRVRNALDELGGRAGHWVYVSSVSVYADVAEPGADEGAEIVAPLAYGQPADALHYAAAKVACEHSVARAFGDEALIVRAGLIGGAMDTSDRFGYWPARFARDNTPVLVPATAGLTVQVIGVSALAAWLLRSAEGKLSGTFNAVGDPVPFAEVIRLAREVARKRNQPHEVAPFWLTEMNVSYWAGPESLPLWLPPDYAGFSTRSNAAASAAGLTQVPLKELMAEAMAYERELGLRRKRRAGLSPHREMALLQLWQSRDETV